MKTKNKRRYTAIDFALLGILMIKSLFMLLMFTLLISLFTSCATSYNGCPVDYTTKYDSKTGTYKKVK